MTYIRQLLEVSTTTSVKCLNAYTTYFHGSIHPLLPWKLNPLLPWKPVEASTISMEARGTSTSSEASTTSMDVVLATTKSMEEASATCGRQGRASLSGLRSHQHRSCGAVSTHGSINAVS